MVVGEVSPCRRVTLNHSYVDKKTDYIYILYTCISLEPNGGQRQPAQDSVSEAAPVIVK